MWIYILFYGCIPQNKLAANAKILSQMTKWYYVTNTLYLFFLKTNSHLFIHVFVNNDSTNI